MTLEFAIQQYPFRFGLSEGTDPHQVPPGTLLTAENAVWKQSGRIEKRLGVSSLTLSIIGGGSIAAGSRLFCRGTELCLVDGDQLYAYSPASVAWKSVDPVPEVGLTWSPLMDNAAGVAATDVAMSTDGLLVHAWVVGDPTATTNVGNVFVQVLDRATGAVLIAPVVVDNGASGVRVHVIGTNAYVISRSTATFKGRIVDLSTKTVAASSVTLRSNGVAGCGWDSMVIGSTIVLAYEHTAAAPKLVLYSFDTALAPVTSGAITGEAGSGILSVGLAGAAGEQIFVAYYVNTGTNVKFATVNPSTLAQVTAPSLVETVQIRKVSICRYDATSAVIAYTTRASVPTRTTTRFIENNGTASIYKARGTWYTSMCARPFMLGTKCYLPLCEASPNTFTTSFDGANTYLVQVDVTSSGALASNSFPHRYVGKVDVITGAAPIDFEPVPTPIVVSATEVVYPSFFLATAPASFNTWRAGLRLASATIGSSRPTDMWRSVTYAGAETFLTAGASAAYDGRSVFDYGFARGPFIFSSTLNSPLGGIVAGTYLYATHLEYRSAAGLLHRSPTAVLPTAITVAVTPSRNTLVVFGTSLSSKQKIATGFTSETANTVVLPFYRTTVGGTVNQRLTIDPTYNFLENDPLLSSQNYVDSRSDASIDGLGTALASRPTVYTTGGILDDYSPPAAVTSFIHADRIWTLAGDERTWWYSKAFQDDLGVAPGFHPQFRISFDDVQTAGATMDNKAIFFSPTGVRFMEGVGPAPNGGNTDFQVPSVIQSDVGCTNARSVVGTPDGVMFLSTRGIYLLNRELELAWIGRPVKDTLAAYPNITSAVLVAKHNQVRFTANSADGTAGVVIVYDYIEKQWTTSRYNAGGSIADACMWNDAWTFVTTTGQVYTESTTSYLDDGAYVPMTLETAWISASGPLAFHSVKHFAIHGTSYTDHNLTIESGFDSEAAYTSTATFPAECPVTSVGDERAEVTIGTRRKCVAIRFRIRDAAPSTGTQGIGRGPAFDMMGIEVGSKRGFQSTGATKKG